MRDDPPPARLRGDRNEDELGGGFARWQKWRRSRVKKHRPAERPIHRDADEKILPEMCKIVFDEMAGRNMLLSR